MPWSTVSAYDSARSNPAAVRSAGPAGRTRPLRVDPMSLVVGEKRIAGTGSAGVPATREMLAFCGEHGMTADVEVVPAGRLAEAMERLARGDVRFRFSVALR